MQRVKVKIGDRFERLLVVEMLPSEKGFSMCLCKCECGKTVKVRCSGLTSGHNTSCGCKIQEHAKKFSVKHGLSKTKIYSVWRDMKSRCYQPNNRAYKDYGQRGITVCDEWKNNPKAFCEWSLENGYRQGLEIDRINVNDGYSPNNCRFVTRRTNCLNCRRTLLYHGEPLKFVCERENLSYQAIQSYAKKHGCSIECSLENYVLRNRKELKNEVI